MALSIKAPKADRLAEQLSRLTGESKTAAVIVSMRERLEREQRKQQNKLAVLAEIHAIADHYSSLPIRINEPTMKSLAMTRTGFPLDCRIIGNSSRPATRTV
jgi:antitoxin VapB